MNINEKETSKPTTVLYPSPVYGPVHSRRMGVSLGLNLMPADGKICSFDCLYCECGFNKERPTHAPRPKREDVRTALEQKLKSMKENDVVPDVLTFAGNGEPTLHPDFPGIIDDTIRLRDIFCPSARISVLSNATTCHRPEVAEALRQVDYNILKLDTVSPDYIRRVCRPVSEHYDVKNVVKALEAFSPHVIIQTIFIEGEDENGDSVCNTSDAFVLPWLEAVKRIKPESVMIYTISRTTPLCSLKKALPEQLDAIADKVREAGVHVTVSY